jgi:hypothetical protein
MAVRWAAASLLELGEMFRLGHKRSMAARFVLPPFHFQQPFDHCPPHFQRYSG